MLHHVTLWVPDLGRAERSWGWLLGEMGYRVEQARSTMMLFRHQSGFVISLEQSPDMVPGMLYSRLRPGLNHLAFEVDTQRTFDELTAAAGAHGWSHLPLDRHPIAGGAEVAYLEDGDGFEVELVVALRTT